MINLLFSLLFAEAALIVLLLVKTPLRKLAIMGLDWVKRGRGRGPVMVKTIAATVFIVLVSTVYSIVNIQKRSNEAGAVTTTDEILMGRHLLEASLMGEADYVMSNSFTLEVYVDDMLVKSVKASDHLADLGVAFSILREYRMKLNLAKCVFGVGSGKFLGFQVSQRGIEANPDKIKALFDMSSPRTTKEIQCLTARVIALGRFISRATDRCLPFFQQLKGHKKAEWTHLMTLAASESIEVVGST